MEVYKVYGKYFFKRDTVFATVFVFMVVGLLALIPLNIAVLDPIKTALNDFEFNDLAYAKLGKNSQSKLDDRQVIVNVGWLDRVQIAQLLQAVHAGGAKAVGLDVQFNGPKDAAGDAILYGTMDTLPQLVVASNLRWVDGQPSIDSGYFRFRQGTNGYVNLIGEHESTIRYYSPHERAGKQAYPCFTSALVKKYDSAAYNRLLNRSEDVELIHYTRRADRYLIVEGTDVLEGKVSADAFRNKLVLVGYVSNNPNDIEDKHFSPMNAKFAGRASPDMNGVVIHANIISMVLSNNYVNQLPTWLNWIITVLLSWLHIAVFIRYYVENHLWFHLVAKIAQFFSVILFVYLGIILYDSLGVKIDFKVFLIVLVLAIDIIYFYEAFAIWLHKRFGFKTVFIHNNHSK